MIAVLLAMQIVIAPSVPSDTAARSRSAPAATSADTAGRMAITRTDRTNHILAPEGDAWLGPDKFKHAAMTYAITTYTFAATDSEPAAVATGALSGILKEIYDRRRGSLFSVRDLVWDAAGIALGYVVVKQTR
jgi:uncharacterized protein YfiM (DUF2279 family)